MFHLKTHLLNKHMCILLSKVNCDQTFQFKFSVHTDSKSGPSSFKTTCDTCRTDRSMEQSSYNSEQSLALKDACPQLVLSTFFTLIGNINYKMNFILNQTQPLERQYSIHSQSKINGKHTCKHIHSKYTDKHRENSFTSSKGSTTGKGQAALWMSNNGEGIL